MNHGAGRFRSTSIASASFVQVERTIQPVCPLVVRAVPPASQHLEQLAETVGGITLSRTLRRYNHRFILGSVRPVSVHRVTDSSDSAGSANADAVCLLEVSRQFSSNGWLDSFFRPHPLAVYDLGSAPHTSASACGFSLQAP